MNYYRVVGGKRQEVARAKVKVSRDEWHSLTLRAKGKEFTVVFDGRPVLTTKDDRFSSPGKIALWTKADSITRFDRIEIKPLE